MDFRETFRGIWYFNLQSTLSYYSNYKYSEKKKKEMVGVMERQVTREKPRNRI